MAVQTCYQIIRTKTLEYIMGIHSNTFDQTQKLMLGAPNLHPVKQRRSFFLYISTPGFHKFVFSKCLRCHRVAIALPTRHLITII